ncbi:uncharacterized protein TNCV_309381 [Trichonephila clavipes]|nr:uncharacterized protein TNCV_309381 [Trichonephila clavipes]
MDPVEDFMRNTLKKIMTCPINDEDYFVQQPVAALSPARYMQLVALVRKDSKELSCGKVRSVSFEINDPRTWNFCTMGVCLSEECVCFQNFKSDKCNKFHGNCWLFYCFLVGCELDLPSLHCGCDSSLYGKTVTTKTAAHLSAMDAMKLSIRLWGILFHSSRSAVSKSRQ